MAEWAARLPEDSISILGHLRCLPDLDAVRNGDTIWLRGHGQPSGALRRVPDLKLYQLDANGVLRRQGERVPFATLPEMKWSALTDFWELELPPTVFSANPPDPCEIRLEASDTVSNPSALVTEPSFLLALADDAPAIRLAAFCFAATNTKKVVLIGDTLPPIPGDRYVCTEMLYVRSGWTWTPHVPTPIIRHGLRADEMVFLSPKIDDPSSEQDVITDVVSGEGLVQASRESIRITAEKLDWNR